MASFLAMTLRVCSLEAFCLDGIVVPPRHDAKREWGLPDARVKETNLKQIWNKSYCQSHIGFLFPIPLIGVIGCRISDAWLQCLGYRGKT